MDAWNYKIYFLKDQVKRWVGVHVQEQQKELEKVEASINSCQYSLISKGFLDDIKRKLCSLAERKACLLREKEERWWLKSRDIWIKEGEKNTNLFS